MPNAAIARPRRSSLETSTVQAIAAVMNRASPAPSNSRLATTTTIAPGPSRTAPARANTTAPSVPGTILPWRSPKPPAIGRNVTAATAAAPIASPTTTLERCRW